MDFEAFAKTCIASASARISMRNAGASIARLSVMICIVSGDVCVICIFVICLLTVCQYSEGRKTVFPSTDDNFKTKNRPNDSFLLLRSCMQCN